MRQKDQGPCIWDYRKERRGWGHGIQIWDLSDDDPRHIHVVGHGSASKPLVGKDPMADLEETARKTGIRMSFNGHYGMAEGDCLLVSETGSLAFVYRITDVDYQRDPRDMFSMDIRLVGPWDRYSDETDISETTDNPELIRAEDEKGNLDGPEIFRRIGEWESAQYGSPYGEGGRGINLEALGKWPESYTSGRSPLAITFLISLFLVVAAGVMAL